MSIEPASLELLTQSLTRSAADIAHLDDPVSIIAVMRGMGGREKAWSPVLRALLSGDYPYALGRDGRIVRAIQVQRADADAIRAITFEPADWPAFPFAGEIFQGDVCDILNVSIRNRDVVGRYRMTSTHRGWRFDRARISGLARKVVTSSELCARSFLKPKTAGAIMRRARIAKLEFGFVRDGAVDQFDACLID